MHKIIQKSHTRKATSKKEIGGYIMSKRCKNSTNSNAVSQNSESKNAARNAARNAEGKNYSNCSERSMEKNGYKSKEQNSDYESNGYK